MLVALVAVSLRSRNRKIALVLLKQTQQCRLQTPTVSAVTFSNVLQHTQYRLFCRSRAVLQKWHNVPNNTVRVRSLVFPIHTLQITLQQRLYLSLQLIFVKIIGIDAFDLEDFFNGNTDIIFDHEPGKPLAEKSQHTVSHSFRAIT